MLDLEEILNQGFLHTCGPFANGVKGPITFKANFVSPPCALDGENHKEFFNECKPSCAHFVATEYGHMDMLNDDGIGPRDSMRRALGGLVVAFLRAQLNNLWKDFNAILADPYLALPGVHSSMKSTLNINFAFLFP
ncbi:hypothetical protein JHK82_018000 [Glycine max]|nr:hypothetical protein JHK82_018000 [Glycine max]